MITQNKRHIVIVLSVPLLLIIPLIANQFADGEGWSLFDFVLMGGLLLGTGLVCEFVLRKVKNMEHRLAICGGILLVLSSFGQNLPLASLEHLSPDRK